MKKRLTKWALVVLITILSCQYITQVQATPTMTSRVVDDQGADGRLYLDAQNNPHIFYYRQILGDMNYPPSSRSYAEWTGQEWDIQEITNTADNIFIMDTKREPHVISLTGGVLKDTRLTGSHWNFNNIGVSEFANNTMLLDSSGKLHAIYVNTTYLDESHQNSTIFLQYNTWTNTSQITQTLEKAKSSPTSRFSIESLSIALDSTGKPQIIFKEKRETALKTEITVKYAKWTGSDWNIQTIGSLDAVYNFCLDTRDQPHLCYFYKDLLHYAYLNGTIWVDQTVTTKMNNTANYHATLALDTDNNPEIFFFREDYGRKIEIYLVSVKWSGTECNTERIVTLQGNLYAWSPRLSNIVVDNSSNPHFVYATSVAEYRTQPVYGELTYVSMEDVPIDDSFSTASTMYWQSPQALTLIATIVGTIIVVLLAIFLIKRKLPRQKLHN
jgi:hypothetical protein